MTTTELSFIVLHGTLVLKVGRISEEKLTEKLAIDYI
jgi:hypothetical protein